MNFGIFTMPEHVPWSNWNLAYDVDLEKIQFAEKLGFSEFWIGEHHAGGYENVPVPEYYIARASAVTSTIKLGTGTVNLPYHDPFMVAERLAFLDQLTKGRLIYGVGGGGLPFDQELFGTGPTAGPRFDEALSIVERLWSSSEPISHEGEFYAFENREIQVRPYQDPPPITVAGLRNLNKYELCGERGYGPMSMYYVRPHAIAGMDALSLNDQINAAVAAAERAGRDPDEPRRGWRILREVYVSDSREKAIEELRQGHRYSYDYILALGIGGLIKDREDMELEEMTFEWMIDSFPMIIGSPEECIRQIQELQEETGGFGTLILNDRNWVTLDQWKRSKELFMRYVAPAFIQREDQARRRRLVDGVLSRSEMWPTDWWANRPQPGGTLTKA
jgi:limonene 1,2-monooxygenase